MSRRTRIKICGLREPRDVAAAVDAGADAIGLVFHPQSPRCVSLARAVELAQQLPPFVAPVGLFVNAPASDIERACLAIPGLLLQFHGDESPAECESYGRPFMKAARMTPELALLDFARRYVEACGIVLDAHVESFGGSGMVFDWSLVPSGVSRPLVLSGGLHAANVAAGIRQLRPWAVDVSSGVEASKGVKDAEAIQRFCDAVRAADRAIDADADRGSHA